MKNKQKAVKTSEEETCLLCKLPIAGTAVWTFINGRFETMCRPCMVAMDEKDMMEDSGLKAA